MTQTAQILDLLRERGELGLTSLDALRDVRSFRLAARILDLRHAGFEISSEIETTPTGKRIARYRLEAEPPPPAARDEPEPEPPLPGQMTWL